MGRTCSCPGVMGGVGSGFFENGPRAGFRGDISKN